MSLKQESQSQMSFRTDSVAAFSSALSRSVELRVKPRQARLHAPIYSKAIRSKLGQPIMLEGNPVNMYDQPNDGTLSPCWFGTGGTFSATSCNYDQRYEELPQAKPTI
jgi:hypothetical protein